MHLRPTSLKPEKSILSFCGTLLLLVAISLLYPRGGTASDLASQLLPLIEEHNGQVAIAIKHFSTGEAFAYRADEPMPTASLIKFPVMVEAYRQAHTDCRHRLCRRQEIRRAGNP